MAAMILPTALFSVLMLWQPVSAVEVRYFYSPLKDSCAWGGSNTFPATNLTAFGGVCAYVPSRNRLFACPTPGPDCWGFNVNCLGGTTETAGPNQILCGKSNARQWCCGEDEACTVTPNQINVCIPNYIPNPNTGISAAEAQAKEFAALPSESIVTSLPRSTPSVFSVLSPESSSTSKTSTIGGPRPVSSNASISNTVSITATAGGSSGGGSTSGGDSSSGISGGAIAGIVIGAIAGTLLIVGLVAFLLMRKRRQNKAIGPDGGLYEKPNDVDQPSPYPPSATTVVNPTHNSGYYGDQVYAKHGPVDTAYEPHQAPQELPSHSKPQELP